MARLITLVVLVLVFWVGCARAPLKGPSDALRLTSTPDLADDLLIEPFVTAVLAQIKHLEESRNHQRFVFGENVFTKEEYLKGMRKFVELAQTTPSKEAFLEAIDENFDFYEVYGQKDDWSEAFFTSYFEVVIPGSNKKTKRFSQPIYKTPDDLVAVDLSVFDEKFAQERKYRGRLVEKKLLPYYTREEIESGKALDKKKLELAWADPLDVYVLHVQGSGTVEFPDGKRLRLGYADKNGARYESLAKFLRDVIPIEEMNLHTIESHLRRLPESEMRQYLYRNPSYVFFQPVEANALTYIGLPATEGRTVAVDQRYFPKGAIAFISATKPVFETPESLAPKEWVPFSRFVLDQDIGGAITGGGRADIFWGKGFDAKRYAGVMKQWGKMYYIAPKKQD